MSINPKFILFFMPKIHIFVCYSSPNGAHSHILTEKYN